MRSVASLRGLKNASEIREYAHILRHAPDATWDDHQTEFLDQMMQFKSHWQIYRQTQRRLRAMENYAYRFSSFKGFKVRTLIEKCYQAHCDLSETSADFIVQLHRSRTEKLTYKQGRWLFSCCHQLGILERYTRFDYDILDG